jgi:hypothetical protein
MNQLELFPDSQFKSLAQARHEFHQTLAAGDETTCPVCSRYAKIRAQGITSTMAYAMCWITMESHHGLQWANVNKEAPRVVLESGGAYAQLVHWSLIYQKVNDDDPTKKTSGLWKPTPKGIDFALGKISVPKQVKVFNKRGLEFTAERVTIHDCKGNLFDYQEVMKPAPLHNPQALI